MKLLKGVPPTPAGEEPPEEDPDGFLILDMFDEALQDTAKRIGEDVENPDETALLVTIDRNGLSDRVVPRVFTNGSDVILKQAEIEKGPTKEEIAEAEAAASAAKRLSLGLRLSSGRLSIKSAIKASAKMGKVSPAESQHPRYSYSALPSAAHQPDRPQQPHQPH